MPRVTKKSQLAKRDDKAAPFLFDYDSLPVREDLVEITRVGRYVHTGARLLDNEEQAQRIVNRMMLRHGIERIARDEKVSPHSIRKMRAALVAQGKMAGFVKRFVESVEEIIESGMIRFHEGILSGEVHPAQLPVGLGIFFDKRALALGEPTAISVGASAQLRPEALSVRSLNEWADRLAVDVESTVSCPVTEQTQQHTTVGASVAPEATKQVWMPRDLDGVAEPGTGPGWGGGAPRRAGSDLS